MAQLTSDLRYAFRAVFKNPRFTLVAVGALALGTYQAIFLCEFDGPKARSVYVSVLA